MAGKQGQMPSFHDFAAMQGDFGASLRSCSMLPIGMKRLWHQVSACMEIIARLW